MKMKTNLMINRLSCHAANGKRNVLVSQKQKSLFVAMILAENSRARKSSAVFSAQNISKTQWQS